MKQTKYPVYFNIAFFQSLQKSLVGFSKKFDHKQHRKHFIHLILSIVNQGSTRLKEAQQIFADRASSVVENLSHFLKSKAWSISLLAAIHDSFIKNRLPKSIYVILDFTALTKTGKKFEYLDQVYDGRDNSVVKGFNLHLALGVNPENEREQYILNHTVCSAQDPNWKGENSTIISCLAQLVELYKTVKISLKAVIHIGDRGFDRKYIIQQFIEHKSYFLIRAKNKSIILKDGTETKLYLLDKGIYSAVYIKAWKMKLKVVVLKAREKEDDQREEKMILLTNLPRRKLSRKKTKKIYQTRWNIETCNKKLKGNYGLEDFRVRTWCQVLSLLNH